VALFPRCGGAIVDYYIEGIRPQDWEAIRIWRNKQMAVLRQTEYIMAPEQINYAKAYYESQATYCAPQLLYSFFKRGKAGKIVQDYMEAIEVMSTFSLIGYGGLVHIDWNLKVAEISFLMNPERKEDLLQYTKEYLIFLELLRDYTAKLGLMRWRFVTPPKTGDPTRAIHVSIAREVFGAGWRLNDFKERSEDYSGNWVQEFNIR
jgi:hypothetical protein